MTIEQRINKVICEQLKVDANEIKPQSRFIEDLGADSLDTVELVMAFEEEFGIEIGDDLAEQIKSVADVLRLVNERAAA
ncbi:MAG: acyl carrier protein [Hahellaceae bacterium]|nr:acyl carrier protein [Hahellaceae bacterium]